MLNGTENAGFWTRRELIRAAGALGISSALTRLASAEPDAAGGPTRDAPANVPGGKEAPLIRIGIFLSTFSGKTIEAKLDSVKASGLDCVQLAMESAGLAPMPDEIAPEMLDRIRREAAAREIEIASMQGTFNMCHPDADYRAAGVRRIKVLADACTHLGTPRIHLCTGTRDRISMWRHHPKNDSPEAWHDMAACVRDAVDIAQPSGVTLAFEPEVNNVVDSAKKARQLLDEIASPHLKVTMDASNLFHAGEFAHMSDVLDESFSLVGKDIVMAHAKDVSHDGDAGHEAAGHGKLDYDRYLSLLHANGFKGPLFLHGLTEAQVPGCVAFLRDKIARLAATASKTDPPR
jgi:sugar phosphate isomerase/epimerase